MGYDKTVNFETYKFIESSLIIISICRILECQLVANLQSLYRATTCNNAFADFAIQLTAFIDHFMSSFHRPPEKSCLGWSDSPVFRVFRSD